MMPARPPMTALRQRMQDDLQLRNYAPQTIDCSLRCVAQFAQYFRTPPDRLGPEQVRQYPLSLVQETRVSWSRVMQTVCALRFFSTVTLGQPHMLASLPHPKRPTTLPTILSQAAVAALLRAPRRLKSRAMLPTSYAAGLRVSELCHLHVPDVDSARLVLRLQQGKGQQDRYGRLSPRFLPLLRQSWQRYTPRTWLCPGPDPTTPITRETVRRLCHDAGVKAGVGKPVHPHPLRHGFASHVLEAGVDGRRLQLL